MNEKLLGTMRDIFPKHGVQIQIQQDGLVIWVNIDGVCVLRILNNGLTIPIEIEDNRK
jgi:hypothetical protein